MARPKKDASAAAPDGSSIPVQEFLRTRDSVVTGLTTLQSSITQLVQAYVTHCNTIVGGGTSNSLDISNFLNNVPTEPLVIAAPPAGAPVETKTRRKRVKKEKDPYAPKRPLTAYFLYSHHAREIIKDDLRKAGEGVEPKSQEIQDEATKRWNNMSPDEKKGWTDTYNTNYEKYKIEVAAYQTAKKQEALEAGATEDQALAAVQADSESDEEIVRHKVPTPPVTKAAATKAAPASAAKKPRKNAKAAANGVTASPAPAAASKAVVTPVPLPSETPKAGAAKAGSKKRKKDDTKEKETPAKAPAAEEEAPKKKARKSKAAVETPPTAPEPEKKKRKRKSEAAS